MNQRPIYNHQSKLVARMNQSPLPQNMEIKDKGITEKQQIIQKLKGQNEKLKNELKMLTGKLEEFVEKSR